MECKVGYIRGHGFSALEELGLPKRKWQKMLCGHTAVNSRPRAGDGRDVVYQNDIYILSE